jgi:hypothetical protein
VIVVADSAAPEAEAEEVEEERFSCSSKNLQILFFIKIFITPTIFIILKS